MNKGIKIGLALATIGGLGCIAAKGMKKLPVNFPVDKIKEQTPLGKYIQIHPSKIQSDTTVHTE